MKKILLLSLTLLLSAVVTPASADKKKEKKKAKAAVSVTEQPVQLVTARDSLSYAAGFASTDGLREYLLRQYQVEPEQMGAFAEGFKEALTKAGDADYRARSIGVLVSDLFRNRILPDVTESFANTPDSLNAELFTRAFIAGVMKDTTLYTMDRAKELTEARSRAIKEEKDAAWRVQNTQWLMNNKDQEGVIVMPSGLQYKVLTQGKGEVPTEKDRVTVKYEGRLIDGTVFDSSYRRDPQTTAFRVNQVIKGWTEALCMMPVGSKWEVYIPQDLGYGARQQGKDIKPYSTLIFTVELVSIDKE